MSDILENDALWIKKCPLGIIERNTVLLDVHGVLRLISLECTLRHNADMISNLLALRQYENMAERQYIRTKQSSR